MHVLAANGAFVELSAVPEELLSAAFRSEVLKFIVAKRAVSEALAQHMLGRAVQPDGRSRPVPVNSQDRRRI